MTWRTTDPLVRYKGTERRHSWLITAGVHDDMKDCPVCGDEEERAMWPTGRKRSFLKHGWFERDV